MEHTKNIVVLVCGGRTYSNYDRIKGMLDKIHATHRIKRLIEGGAKGADRLARIWALNNLVPYVTYNADWKRHGLAAGPIRNEYMLKHSNPDMVVAFPGSSGTQNMIMLALEADVMCIQVDQTLGTLGTPP